VEWGIPFLASHLIYRRRIGTRRRRKVEREGREGRKSTNSISVFAMEILPFPPLHATICSGVSPLLAFASNFAPKFVTRYLTRSTWPTKLAKCSTVISARRINTSTNQSETHVVNKTLMRALKGTYMCKSAFKTG
jgi:hypothetical protein